MTNSRRSGRVAAALARRVSAAELLGPRVPAYVPDHYLGAFGDTESVVHLLERMCMELGAELPGDLDPCHCTDNAIYFSLILANGDVTGFARPDNPGTATGDFAGGHDFCVYDDRFIIDPWAVDSMPEDDRPATKYVHDLADPRDDAEVRRLYGKRSKWSRLPEPTPRRREYEAYEDEDLLGFIRLGKPGALSEALARGIEVLREAIDPEGIVRSGTDDPMKVMLERVARSLKGTLPGDLQPSNCSTVALYLKTILADTEIFGYDEEENPTSEISQLAGGHDFAVVGGRYILDPWAVDTDPVTDRYVWDLDDPADAAEIQRIYGDRACWQENSAFGTPQYCQFWDQDDESLLRLVNESPTAVQVAMERGLAFDVLFKPPAQRPPSSQPRRTRSASPAV